MKLLVTGAKGQVGWELARSLMPLGEVVALDRSNCDLAQPAKLDALIDRIAPDVIVNAAAYTAVDRAQTEQALAHCVNAEAVGALARCAKRHGALMVHYSTDYVFDGSKTTPYTENDPTAPLNVYGQSKLAGELAIEAAGCEALILRTTWVYASRGANFVATMLRLFRERERLGVVADQFGAPTWARNIADTTAHLVRWAQTERGAGRICRQRFNLSAGGRTSWHGFAEEILRQARVRWPEQVWAVKSIDAIATEAYPLPAPRPANSCLDGALLANMTGLKLPDWGVALAACLAEMSHP